MHSAPSLSAWRPPETTSTLVSTLHPTESHLSVPTAANASDTLYSLSVTYVPMLGTYYLVTIYDVMSSYVVTPNSHIYVVTCHTSRDED